MLVIAGNMLHRSKVPERFLNKIKLVGQTMYEGHLESKERFDIQRYLLIIGKKMNMQVL